MKKIPKFVYIVAALVFLTATTVLAATVVPYIIPGGQNISQRIMLFE